MTWGNVQRSSKIIYIHYSFNHPDDRALRGTVDHASAGAIYIHERYGTGDAVDRLASEMIALVIASHHGGLMNCINLEGRSDFLTRLQKDKTELSYNEALDRFQAECFSLTDLDNLFNNVKSEVENIVSSVKTAGLPNNFAFHLICKFLFSCLIDADRYDTMQFMSDFPEPEQTNSQELWHRFSDRLEEELKSYSRDTTIQILRGEISDSCKASGQNPKGIYSLTAPTGGGKTISSLRFALEHCKKFNKDRIIYIVPYTTIIDQNANIVREILRCGDLLLEHHSNVIADNEDEDYKLLTQRWDSPIIFTTMVQFLNTLYAGGTQNIRRLHNLANSVLIFDEIQAIPVKCIHLLNCGLNFLSSICNSTIVSCTATQPLLNKVQRPLSLSDDGDIIPDANAKLFQFKRVNLVDRTKNGGWDFGELAQFVFKQMENLNSALLIMNTKSAAQNLYNEILKINDHAPESERCHVIHLSTNMCPAHRMQCITDLKEKLGQHRIICISTQLIEAGVDISFQFVIRAMAGLDSICQAAGRCNRHGETHIRNLFIVNIKNESLRMLPDIRIGQECTSRILDEFKSSPQDFDGDLLSLKAIERFYTYYYFARKNEMDYTLKNKTSLYDLLSMNAWGKAAYESQIGNPFPFPLKQAFKDAGAAFHVIEENTTSVLVPFDYGKELISKLNGNCFIWELPDYIKQAQRYSVNLFKHEIDQLNKKHAIYELKNAGLWALAEQFYDRYLGVTMEGQINSFLMV